MRGLRVLRMTYDLPLADAVRAAMTCTGPDPISKLIHLERDEHGLVTVAATDRHIAVLAQSRTDDVLEPVTHLAVAALDVKRALRRHDLWTGLAIRDGILHATTPTGPVPLPQRDSPTDVLAGIRALIPPDHRPQDYPQDSWWTIAPRYLRLVADATRTAQRIDVQPPFDRGPWRYVTDNGITVLAMPLTPTPTADPIQPVVRASATWPNTVTQSNQTLNGRTLEVHTP